jgi:hypothetical protein
MHKFSELIYRSAVSALSNMEESQRKIEQALQTSAATPLIKSLQTIRMQKTILVVGMFSIFEAWLQSCLATENGFVKAKEILTQSGNSELLDKFIDLELANNALKHGRGRSYNALLARNRGTLHVQIKQPGEVFFEEGDVSEINTLINVDENFINHCVAVIEAVSDVVSNSNRGSQWQRDSDSA